MFNCISCCFVSKSKFEVENGFLSRASIFYITNGEIQYIINDKSETAKSGDIVFFPTDMYFERKITKPITFYHIIFENPKKNPLPYGKVFFSDKNRLLSTLEYLYNLEIIPNDNQKLKNYFLNDIFIQLETELFVKHVQKDEIVIKTKNFFEKNIDKKISLKEISTEIGASVPCIMKHFQNAVGMSPIKYFILLKIKYAQTLLCYTDLTVTQISERCGFENPYYFSYVFKKHKNMSPSTFRKKFKV